MSAVALEGVSKWYPHHGLAVDELDLTVNDGELLVIVGPSGGGKTTALRLIAGLEDVTRGVIRIGGRVVNRMAPRDRNIAMVFQQSVLYPHLTVYQNLAFATWLRRRATWLRPGRPMSASVAGQGSRGDEGLERVIRQTARKLGMEHLLGRLPRQLSGGERQRVALGRALVRRPAAFLLDEPLSSLDAQLRADLRRELKRLQRQREATMVYVTHDLVEALSLGDRIVVMNRGKIQQQGTPWEVYDHPANLFVAGFLGQPAMNLVPGRLESHGDRVRFVGPGMACDLTPGQVDRFRRPAGGDLVMGIRSEDVRLTVGAGSRADDANGTAQNAVRGRVIDTEWNEDRTLVRVAVLAGGRGGEDGGDEDGGCELVSKIRARTNVANGAEVVLNIDVARAYVFDAQTGEKLD